jgi:hypothetical protein
LTSKALENPKIQEKVRGAVIITAVFEALPLLGTTVGREIKLTEELGKEMDVDAEKFAKFRGKILILSVEYDAPKLKKQCADFVKRLQPLKPDIQTKVSLETITLIKRF